MSLLMNNAVLIGSGEIDEFIITVKTDNTGSSNDNQFYLPMIGTSFEVQTSEESLSGLSGATTLTWTNPGTYTVKVRGTYNRIFFNNAYDAKKLIYINKWSNTKWTSMAWAFFGCSNLTGCDSQPPILSSVTDMAYMFQNCTLFNSDLSNWDVSTIENMGLMFYNCTSFDQDLSTWNVSNVQVFVDFGYNITLSSDNYDTTLIGWELLNLTNGLSIDFGNSKYSTTGQTAKNAIISDDNWTFSDGGLL